MVTDLPDWHVRQNKRMDAVHADSLLSGHDNSSDYA
jgi:hypothetical protein